MANQAQPCVDRRRMLRIWGERLCTIRMMRGGDLQGRGVGLFTHCLRLDWQHKTLEVLKHAQKYVSYTVKQTQLCAVHHLTPKSLGRNHEYFDKTGIVPKDPRMRTRYLGALSVFFPCWSWVFISHHSEPSLNLEAEDRRLCMTGGVSSGYHMPSHNVLSSNTLSGTISLLCRVQEL
ncbi:hypothetical protein RRG08_036136 [Elysia crispata]|uniref:Uncharacterized protein n=1 Tax=Elysia crispata TaxID=231223 RepID=A0AAE1DH52_9GAST|nr:hypothetical protein RRG08_036136 [Elysia crispata]